MRDYGLGKIYKIISIHTDLIYIGSTIQPLSKRLGGHKRDYKNGHYVSSQEIIKLGDYKIVLIHNFSCKCSDELQAEEQRIIETYDKTKLVNYKRAFTTIEKRREMTKEYREANKEKLKIQRKEYKEVNKDIINIKKKAYREANKDIIKIKRKEYNEANKDNIKEYSEANKDKRKEYNETNKEHRKQQRKYRNYILGELVDIL